MLGLVPTSGGSMLGLFTLSSVSMLGLVHTEWCAYIRACSH